jgi:outer membrane protein assembly factor BamB
VVKQRICYIRQSRLHSLKLVGLMVQVFKAQPGVHDMSHRIVLLASLVLLPLLNAALGQQSAVESLLNQIDTRKGICVLVGVEDAELPIRLASESELLIYVQSDRPEVVSTLQKATDKAGLLGHRIYVEQGDPERIHLADNLADTAIVAKGDVNDGLRRELLRVTHPGARLLLGDEVITNPRPDGADDWTHPYHGPDNNPQSRDQHVAGPYLTQFLAEPWYVPMPQVTVASGGRLFKAFGHIALKEREWPWLNKLVAINSYNGTMLWKRDLTPGFMLHRNTLIATPDVVYLGDEKSCKVLDAASGQPQDDIRIPKDVDPDGVWKWMALENDVLYALVGPPEPIDTVIRGGRVQAGWPWSDLGKGYGKFGKEYAWGFGRTLLAINPETQEILWTYRSKEPIDSRAMCLAAGRIYVYSHEKYLASVDAESGDELWKTEDEKLLTSIGQHDRAQTASKGFASSAYVKANDKGIYFAGPQRTNLVGVSAKDGSLLWSYPHGNFQLVLRDDALYAMGRMETSKKFDYLSGKILADLDCYRGNCTRATATVDSIFTRGYRHTGTMRLNISGNDPRRIALMRPACQDGVIIADGQLYWGPWMCDCNHSLIGLISLAPSGDFDASQVDEDEQLQAITPVQDVGRQADRLDWPAYRRGAGRAAETAAAIADDAEKLWQHESLSGTELTAPIVVRDTAFWSGLDGVVRAADVASGELRWSAYTGGAVRFAPEFFNGRLYVGSSDGYVYCFEAASGKTLWKFRAAPANRKIAVHGKLLSNWPVGSGVLVAGGVVYAAAGITSYDGTYVYALDALTGKIRWRNNNSGQLTGGQSMTGVSVQGHLLLHDGKLYLAGGNVISPAIYDLEDGRCLNELKNEWWDGFKPSGGRFPPKAGSSMFNRSPRGRELFLVDGKVQVFDQLLYSPPKYGPSRYFGGNFLQAGSGGVIVRGTTNRVVRLAKEKTADGKPVGIWQTGAYRNPIALAVCKNAVVVAGEVAAKSGKSDAPPEYSIEALRLNNGKAIWSETLSAAPVSWGLAVDRSGRAIVTLADGSVVGVGQR